MTEHPNLPKIHSIPIYSNVLVHTQNSVVLESNILSIIPVIIQTKKKSLHDKQ